MVQLKNGEGGIVVRRATASAGIEVAVLLSASGRPVSGGPRRDTAAAGLGIACPLIDRSGLPRILPEQVFGLLYL